MISAKCTTIQDLVRPSPVSYIVPNLFLGDKHIASDASELRRLKITHVVNCAKGLPDPFVASVAPLSSPSSARSAGSESSDEEMGEADDGCGYRGDDSTDGDGDGDGDGPAAQDWALTYHRCELVDSSRAADAFEKALVTAFAFIDEALSAQRTKGGAVLIHCSAGRSRGPALMTAYLIHRYRWSLDKAFTFVCQARPVVCPNRGFLSALLKLEKRQLGANTMYLSSTGQHRTLVSLHKPKQTGPLFA